MVHTLSPQDTQTLLSQGSIDVIDVRDARDWASGHVPGARSVPLEDLRADPKAQLKSDKILFVCARGIRSMVAAELAEAHGSREIYSMEGGMLAWANAALPIETPPAPTSVKPRASEAPPEIATCSLPEPELDAVVGENLRLLRTERSLSLDTLARLTGLSRTLLGQIELGKTSPSVSLVWKLARAFDVPFSTLLASAPPPAISVMPKSQAKRIVGSDGRFASRALFPPGSDLGAEFYELSLAPHSREDAQPHQPGSRESLVVSAGRLELHVGAQRFDLAKGDAIVFNADVPHAYANPDKDECWMYLMMTYGRHTTPTPSSH